MWANYNASVGSRIVRGTSVFVPTVVGFFAVIAVVMPYGSAGGIPLAPLFPLAAIYFFVLTRPAMMTPISVFAIGVMQDLLSGGPLGLWAVAYLAGYSVAMSLRLLFIGRSAGAAWPGFLIVVAVSGIAVWILASLFYQAFVPVVPIAAQMLITAGVFPILAWVFAFFLPASEA